MNQTSAWATILSDNAPVVLVLFSILGITIAKMSHMIFSQHKKIETSALEKVAGKIDELVDQIKILFLKHDGVMDKLDDQGDRLGKLEKSVGEQFTRCGEREKVLSDIRIRQDFNIRKFDAALLDKKDGGRRVIDPPYVCTVIGDEP
jgi:hypothetical protein